MHAHHFTFRRRMSHTVNPQSHGSAGHPSLAASSQSDLDMPLSCTWSKLAHALRHVLFLEQFAHHVNQSSTGSAGTCGLHETHRA